MRPQFSHAVYSLLVLCFVCAFASSADAGQHPCLFFGPDDIPALRQKVQQGAIAGKLFGQLTAQDDSQYEIQYPDLDGTIRKDWHDAVYTIGRKAQTNAFCWITTGDDKYLDIARRILTESAENFEQKLNFHRMKDRSYMRSYFTGEFGVRMASAYDMIYNGLTEAEREIIETKLLRGIVRMVENPDKFPPSDGNNMPVDDYEWGPGQWNGVMYCNAGIAAIGFALDDSRIYEHAVDNFKTYVARDILSDGLFREEDWLYANFCISSLTLVAEMAHNFGYNEDLYNLKLPSRPADSWDANYGTAYEPEGYNSPTRSLRSIYDAVVDCQYPDLSANNLGWQTNRQNFTYSYSTLFTLAHRRFADKPFGWMLSRMRRDARFLGTGRIIPILYGDEPVSAVDPPDTRSRVFNHGGWLILKSIEGPQYWGSDAMYAFMPYGNPRSKGLQRLSLDIFAYGRCVSPRVAKTSRHQSHDHGWYNYQPAWNNLMVDGQNITGRRTSIAESHMRYQDLDPESPVKIAQPVMRVNYAERPSIWADEISTRREDFDHYKGRALMMTADYLLDISHVQFIQPQKILHNYHWNLHGTGEFELVGARHDQKVKAPVSGIWRYDDGVGLKSTLLISPDPDGDGTLMYQYSTPDSTFMQAMKCGRSTLIAAVHEPFRGEVKIDEMTQLWKDEFAIAVKICDNDKYEDLHCFSAVDDYLKIETDKFSADIACPYAFFRLADGVLTVRGKLKAFSFASDFFTGKLDKIIINGQEASAVIGGDGSISWSEK